MPAKKTRSSVSAAKVGSKSATAGKSKGSVKSTASAVTKTAAEKPGSAKSSAKQKSSSAKARIASATAKTSKVSEAVKGGSAKAAAAAEAKRPTKQTRKVAAGLGESVKPGEPSVNGVSKRVEVGEVEAVPGRELGPRAAEMPEAVVAAPARGSARKSRASGAKAGGRIAGRSSTPADKSNEDVKTPPTIVLEQDSDEPLTEEQLRKVKTGLTAKDLEHFRQRLMEHRANILGDVAAVTDDQHNRGGNLSNLPVHMADVGSDNFEQEFTMGLLASEKKLLSDIEDALIRMDKGYYGVCMESGRPIARERLEAKPWAKYCIEVVRERERRGLM